MACAVIFLSFWAEVHYNSIYPEGGKHIHIANVPLVTSYLKNSDIIDIISYIINSFFKCRTSTTKHEEEEEMVELVMVLTSQEFTTLWRLSVVFLPWLLASL